MTEEEGMCASMEASLPFEEKINMEGVHNGDSVLPSYSIEDLTVGLINSRKLSVQAMVSFELELAPSLRRQSPVCSPRCTVRSYSGYPAPCSHGIHGILQVPVDGGIAVTGMLHVTTIYLCTNGQNTLYATKSSYHSFSEK